jgi:dihydrofolate reductase
VPLDFVALAEETVGLVEDKDRAGALGVVEARREVLLGLGDVLETTSAGPTIATRVSRRVASSFSSSPIFGIVCGVLTYYAALSLDGRIAGAGHDLAFLKTLTGAENDYEVFYADVDSLIMGARTWDFMVAHGSWPYAGKPTWIVTHAEELAELPGAEPVEIFAGDLAELVRLIGSQGLKRTWLVGGGDLAGQLLAADLLDELILTLAPALVGSGPALADGAFPLRRFTLTRMEPFGDDGVRLHYDRTRKET